MTKQFASVFSILKLASVFSTKDKVSCDLKSYEIYKFLRAGCNVSYLDKTYRHISPRTYEHLQTDENSNNYRHLLKNPQNKSVCDENYFSILDLMRTKYTLKLKKIMYKTVKILPKQTGKMYITLNSCIEA